MFDIHSLYGDSNVTSGASNGSPEYGNGGDGYYYGFGNGYGNGFGDGDGYGGGTGGGFGRNHNDGYGDGYGPLAALRTVVGDGDNTIVNMLAFRTYFGD